MVRTAILRRCLLSLCCAALVAPAFADDADGCSHFSWDVSHELKVMKQTAAPVTAAIKPGAQAPLIQIDKLYELKLSPQASVTYSAKPAKPTLNDSAQGGLVRFHVNHAGLYRVSITSGHWIDVVDGEQLVKSKDFSGSRQCARPHKIVEFELPADKDLVLQFSGSTDSSVVAAITPVAASLPN
jgi:hypothetical protein